MAPKMKMLALALVCLTCWACTAAVQPGDKKGIAFELRLAEKEPGKDLTGATVEGTKHKVYLHKEAALTNKDIAAAKAKILDGNKHAVEVVLTPAAAKAFAKLTAQHDAKPMAIMLDGKVILAPIVRDTISEGKLLITGDFTKETAEKIAGGVK